MFRRYVPSIKKKIEKIRSENKYRAALKCCKTVAREEYPYAQNACDRAKSLVLKLREQMETIRVDAAERQGTATREAQEKLTELNQLVNEVVTNPTNS